MGKMLSPFFYTSQSPVEAFGLIFLNPLGVAAGYDKDGLAWLGLAHLGFGHIEVGTVTPKPQEGNPRPRLFRLPQERALINRMGFPSRGADYVARQLDKPRPPGLVLGVNLGINKHTPLDEAVDDYAYLMQTFSPLADYLVVNVSSPNTLGLRRLQGREALSSLLSQLAHQRQALQVHRGRGLPLLVKLAPDLTDEELDDALDVITSTGMDGVIATNTTVNRRGINSPASQEPGGLSGAPLRTRSTDLVRAIYHRTSGELPIIGVGGIMSPDDALEKLDAGATLVQVYTGLVYEGPGLGKRILNSWSGR